MSSIRQTLFSNMFWRNMLADFGTRTGDSKTPGAFTPYFQYKIGRYQSDLYLYFPKEPFTTRYKNEIFNKLQEYAGYDIIRYLEFHFDNYSNKLDFLLFLHYEISTRLKQKPTASRKVKLEAALEWASEKKDQLKDQQAATLRAEIAEGLQALTSHQATSETGTEQQIAAFAEKLNTLLFQIMEEAATGMRNLSSSFTGNIELNNRQQEDKIIQLLILLQEVQAPNRKVDQLFKKMSLVDIASILHLHFQAFKAVKFNTVQKKVGEEVEVIRTPNPQIIKLSAALQDFFYK